jgi:pimeloyl-ACP methyl ester carboxylesterase
MRVGSKTLERCAKKPLAYCGSLPVPLNYARPRGPHISIAFRWYPATAPSRGGAQRTVVPVEGGPGYPSIESVSYRSQGQAAGYSVMYGPLLKRWNMLAVDNRGTGASTPLGCPALQNFTGPTGTAAFQRVTAGCAARLNHRWRDRDGSWVHASDLFNSVPAARDMAAVIRALALSKVDLYGDSYGSFFAQVFVTRFPRLVRSVVLDSTYPTRGLDPWYRVAARSMPAAFDAACARWVACAHAAPGSSWLRIGELAASLRQRPISGRVPGSTGKLQNVSMNITGLVDLVSDAAEDSRIYGELDAAARALLAAGHDAAPLLRLYAQREYSDEGYFGSLAREYSVELYVADACLDYPQLFNMHASAATRAAQLLDGEAHLAPGTFGPFSPAEWISQNENTEAFSVCIGWPSPTSAAQQPSSRAMPRLPASLPVLVLGGEFDTWTPPSEVPKVLAQVGGRSRFVDLANSTHVVGEGATKCGSTLVERFVARPRAIDSLNAACAAAVAPIHAVGRYPMRLSEQAPLQPATRSAASSAELRLAAAAVQTAGDAVSRYEAIEAELDHGLHGGSILSTQAGSLLKLKGDQLIAGVAVSGTVQLRPSKNVGQVAMAKLRVSTPGMPSESLIASWHTVGANAAAEVSGYSSVRALRGAMPAP